MSLFRKKPAPQQHPDPAVELKLRSIAALDGLRSAAMRQIAFYQADMERARKDLGRTLRKDATGEYKIDTKRAEQIASARIARAEEGIRRQQEFIIGLGERIEKAISESGLTDADLAYLNLEDQY